MNPRTAFDNVDLSLNNPLSQEEEVCYIENTMIVPFDIKFKRQARNSIGMPGLAKG